MGELSLLVLMILKNQTTVKHGTQCFNNPTHDECTKRLRMFSLKMLI